MPAIRDLNGLGRAAPNAVGVSTGAVTCDDVDAGMVAQPSPDRLRLAVVSGDRVNRSFRIFGAARLRQPAAIIT